MAYAELPAVMMNIHTFEVAVSLLEQYHAAYNIPDEEIKMLLEDLAVAKEQVNLFLLSEAHSVIITLMAYLKAALKEIKNKALRESLEEYLEELEETIGIDVLGFDNEADCDNNDSP